MEKSEDTIERLREFAESAHSLLDEMRVSGDGHHEGKSVDLRYSIREVCEMIGKSASTIYRAQSAGSIPTPEKRIGSGQSAGYTLAELNQVRDHFDCKPWRSETDPPCILAVQNFKGGVGKSTVSTHLSQYLAQQGYRVLLVDADSQATATAMFGFNPDIDFSENDTLLPVLQNQHLDLAALVRPTYWDGLDIIPSNLGLYTAEYQLAADYISDADGMNRLKRSLAPVARSYDVVIIDPPPALGMISLSVVRASNAVLIPCPPLTADFASTATFLQMIWEVAETLQSRSLDVEYQFIKFVLTKTDANKSAQTALRAAMMAVFGDAVLETPLLTSAEYESASLDMRTIYEVGQTRRPTYTRARRNLDAVFAEVELSIRRTWPSHENRILQGVR